MKIGIDARFWDESGVGRYIRNLVWELGKIDKKNTYVLFTKQKNYPELKNPDCATTKWQVPLGWKIVQTNIHWHSLEEQIKFPQILNKENLDLMHFPYFSVPIYYRRPYIVTIHDLILHHFTTGEATTRSPIVYYLKLLGYKSIVKNAAQKAKKIITVSQATKKEIIKHLHVPQEKIAVIYEGVEDKPADKTKDLKINNKNYFLHVGNLYPHKNINLVLSAIKKIKVEDNLSIQLVIVGKKDYFYQRFQKKVKELKLENQVTFLGEATDSQLKNAYQNTLALISPSLMEGFDLPTVEAMANNCLVVASDIPVHHEICKDTAIYFDPKNEKDLILKMKEIFTNGKEKYKDKIKKGASHATEFSWAKMAKETLDIYENSISLR
jgi:glycosyltransferase involved in cell wall biosynthesis